VTWNALQRHNGPYVALFRLNSAAFRAHFMKVIEDTHILSATEM